MKVTLSIIKADIGSIGGHICPSRQVLESVRSYIAQHGSSLVIDHYVSSTGDDIAILMSHKLGVGHEAVHKLAWDAFLAGTAVANQDLLKDAFSGNVRGMGSAVAEMEFNERPNEPFLFFAADKTDPGAFNLPLYLALHGRRISLRHYGRESYRRGSDHRAPCPERIVRNCCAAARYRTLCGGVGLVSRQR